MANISYFFDLKEKISKPGEIATYRLSNFNISTNSDTNIYFEGTYFPFKFNVHYSHLIIDYLGPYLQLKQQYPDLKPIFFKNSELSTKYNTELQCTDLAKHFNAEIIDICKNNYIFDNIILNYRESIDLITLDGKLYPIPLLPTNIFADQKDGFDENGKETMDWIKKSAKEINKHFNKYKINELKEKIYITRSSANKIHKSGAEWLVKTRTHDEKYDEYMENLIKEKGYTIIDTMNMGFFEQIKYYRNAKVIATIDGGSLINSVFKQKDAQVIQIKVNKNYDFYYDKIVEAVYDDKVFVIDVTELDPKDGIDYIINQLP